MTDQVYLSHFRQIDILPEKAFINNLFEMNFRYITGWNTADCPPWPTLFEDEFHRQSFLL
jgi:hypothetical protein